MSDLLERIKKTSVIKETSVLSKSTLYSNKDIIPTEIMALNTALSGHPDGGLKSGTLTIAGPSRHFKSLMGLIMVGAYMQKHKDAIVLFYDSEFGAPESYFKACGVDIERVVHVPVKNIEELKFDLVKQLDSFTRDDKVIIFLDSIGNIASKKEVDDALSSSSKADMTRAKAIKSLFRMVTPYLTINDIPFITIAHTYDTQEMFSKKVVSGGCVVAGTKIQTVDGLKNIEELGVGERVITLNGSNEITEIWNPDTLLDGEPECYEIEFEDTHKVVCSDEHKFLIDGKWVKAKDLTEGSECNVIH